MDGQSSPERCDDASSIVRNQTTSADDEVTVGSGKESDRDDSSEHDNDHLTARSLFAGKNPCVVCHLSPTIKNTCT